MSEPSDSAQPSSPDDKDKAPSRVVLKESELSSLSADEWCSHWRMQDSYITLLEQRLSQQEGDLTDLRQNYDRTKNQLSDSQQKEKVLIRRLTAKEHEMQDYVCQVNELKNAQAPTTTSLRSTLLDPAVNSLLQLLRTELQNTKAKLEETQNDLSAWKFTPDSNTGKRLMAKCRLLYQENEELGKITCNGRVAILEGDLALQKNFSEEVRKSQLELDSFLADLDEDVEGMQSTILFLQQELRKAKDALGALQKENSSLKMPNGRANGDSSSVCEEEDERTTRVKRVRRTSVLSIDYNEDDVINTNGDVVMSDTDYS
ncbi:PREDICTED: pre-mRNA-splicing regulator female-lethal(2)D [Nicrophorus vespilloides]|uniref:Pre-mRNA-splicing regulator female-lethal(2)D n=1 Tax=Nicrophorus vespilloides TaxID=110193 RepID=A0ABM1N6S8_NICVS|nr:PREDICTED: pre-mRNA-splicing regulator female-lethal(2)D [Nicrophorus vespilloides]